MEAYGHNGRVRRSWKWSEVAGGGEGMAAELRSSSRPEASMPQLLLLAATLEEEERGQELREAGLGYL
jgi:hypothetical protein